MQQVKCIVSIRHLFREAICHEFKGSYVCFKNLQWSSRVLKLKAHGAYELIKYIPRLQCKSVWIKVSSKCINVNTSYVTYKSSVGIAFVQSNFQSLASGVYCPFNGITPVLSKFQILVPANCFQIIENKILY